MFPCIVLFINPAPVLLRKGPPLELSLAHLFLGLYLFKLFIIPLYLVGQDLKVLRWKKETHGLFYAFKAPFPKTLPEPLLFGIQALLVYALLVFKGAFVLTSLVVFFVQCLDAVLKVLFLPFQFLKPVVHRLQGGFYILAPGKNGQPAALLVPAFLKTPALGFNNRQPAIDAVSLRCKLFKDIPQFLGLMLQLFLFLLQALGAPVLVLDGSISLRALVFQTAAGTLRVLFLQLCRSL